MLLDQAPTLPDARVSTKAPQALVRGRCLPSEVYGPPSWAWLGSPGQCRGAEVRWQDNHAEWETTRNSIFPHLQPQLTSNPQFLPVQLPTCSAAQEHRPESLGQQVQSLS